MSNPSSGAAGAPSLEGAVMAPTSAPTARPVSLTDHATLVAKAEAYIAWAGLPSVPLVEAAIRRSELAGDPFCDNPYREVLLEVTAAHQLAAGIAG